MRAKEKQESEQDEQAEEQDGDENVAGLTAYRDRERDYGTGDIRIGTSFTFTEDMYSLLFIGQVKTMYIEACEKMQEARDNTLNEMIQEYGNRKLNEGVDNQSL